MKTALRKHICEGRRIYGEGAGVAFLCHEMVTPDGRHARMAGLLPAIAHRTQSSRGEPSPVEARLCRPNWMGHTEMLVRGYRTPGWRLEPLTELGSFLTSDESHMDMTGTFQTIASLLEVHFGTQTNLLNHFFYPHMPTPPDVDPWKSA